MGRHGAPHPTRWLKVAGAQAAILVARGGDGWPAHRRQFGRRSHVGGAEERNWGAGEGGRELTGGSWSSVTAAHLW
jgi:hypothetical protein